LKIKWGKGEEKRNFGKIIDMKELKIKKKIKFGQMVIKKWFKRSMDESRTSVGLIVWIASQAKNGLNCLAWGQLIPFLSQFHQRSTYSFHAHGAQKRKKDSQVVCLFTLLGSTSVKAEHKYVGEIEPWKWVC